MADKSRTFPSLTYILNNANIPPATIGGFQTAENLPAVSRTMNFRCTVRDQRGGVNDSSVAITVAGGAGPFAVTSPQRRRDSKRRANRNLECQRDERRTS